MEFLGCEIIKCVVLRLCSCLVNCSRTGETLGWLRKKNDKTSLRCEVNFSVIKIRDSHWISKCISSASAGGKHERDPKETSFDFSIFTLKLYTLLSLYLKAKSIWSRYNLWPQHVPTCQSAHLHHQISHRIQIQVLGFGMLWVWCAALWPAEQIHWQTAHNWHTESTLALSYSQKLLHHWNPKKGYESALVFGMGNVIVQVCERERGSMEEKVRKRESHFLLQHTKLRDWIWK